MNLLQILVLIGGLNHLPDDCCFINPRNISFVYKHGLSFSPGVRADKNHHSLDLVIIPNKA